MPAPANLVHETSTTTGTGNITLANVNGKNNFNDAFGTGGTDVFDYFISNQAAAEWERGTGHMSDATTLVRDTVIESTNSDNAVDFSAGTKDVTNDIPAASQYNATLREILTANRTYYVRTDGNDGNTGLVDSAGGAFLTIAHALDVVWDTLDLAGFDVTIDVGNGTYTDPLFKERPHVGHGIVTIVGDETTPANVLIDVTGNGVQMYNGAAIRVNGVKIEATARGLYAAWGGHIFFQNVDFGACGSFQIRAAAGEVSATGDYTISGGAPSHWAAHIGGAINVVSHTVTLTGTPAFSTAFAYTETGGSIEAHDNTFSGSATGSRFRVLVGGFIWVGSGVDPNSYLPGNSAGLVLAGAISPRGIVNATSIYSSVKDQSIADDGVYTFDLGALTNGIVLMTIHTGSGAKTAVPVGQFRVRASAAPFTENISLDLTAVTLTTGALTGTTGTDGRFTISPHTDGLVYFENRTGSTRFITLLIM